MSAPWRHHWLNYPYTRAVGAVACPTLVVFAECDLQTPPAYHRPAIEAATRGRSNVEIATFSNLNHFLQPAITGAPSEYGGIAETLSNDVLHHVSDWAWRQIAATGVECEQSGRA